MSALEEARQVESLRGLTCAVGSWLQKDDEVGVELDIVFVLDLDLDGEVLVQVRRSLRASLDSYPCIPPNDPVFPE